MANITDLIAKAVASSTGSISIPSNVKENVLGGLSDSILGSLTQTATKAGGIDQIKSLLTGKVAAEKSPITALAGNLFTKNIISKFNLGGSKAESALTAVIPTVMGKLGGILKDQDGDGDIDLQDILLTLKGGSAPKGKGLLGAAAGILGGMLKK